MKNLLLVLILFFSISSYASKKNSTLFIVSKDSSEFQTKLLMESLDMSETVFIQVDSLESLDHRLKLLSDSNHVFDKIVLLFHGNNTSYSGYNFSSPYLVMDINKEKEYLLIGNFVNETKTDYTTDQMSSFLKFKDKYFNDVLSKKKKEKEFKFFKHISANIADNAKVFIFSCSMLARQNYTQNNTQAIKDMVEFFQIKSGTIYASNFPISVLGTGIKYYFNKKYWRTAQDIILSFAAGSMAYFLGSYYIPSVSHYVSYPTVLKALSFYNGAPALFNYYATGARVLFRSYLLWDLQKDETKPNPNFFPDKTEDKINTVLGKTFLEIKIKDKTIEQIEECDALDIYLYKKE